MIENCLIIPQWIFAAVGLFMIVVSVALAWRNKNATILTVLVWYGSLIMIACGLQPYLPCVVVVP